MSVLIEHQTTGACLPGKHSWNLTVNIQNERHESVGTYKQCLICCTVVEFLLNGDYPND